MQNYVNDEYDDADDADVDDDDDDDGDDEEEEEDNRLSHNAILSDLHKLTARYIFWR